MAGDPRSQQHLGEDGHGGERPRAGRGPARRARPASVRALARSAMKIVAASTVSAMPRWAVTSSARKALEHHRSARAATGR